MLALHQRAACLPTDPPLTWLHFVRARFLGELRERGRTTTLSLTFTSAVQQSEEAAELRGALELASDGALPVVYECVGTLNLATQEFALEDSKAATYTGRFSENGRVISLTGGGRAKPFHLIETGTLATLL